MNSKIGCLVGVLLVLSYSSVDAQVGKPGTIGDLVHKCRAVARYGDGTPVDISSGIDGAWCMGFLQADGVDQAVREGQGAAYCSPDGVILAQRAKILVAWAEKNPQHLHLPDLVGVRMSMQEAFPCPE